MEEKREPRQSKRAITYFKLHTEKYLWGSTKVELRPDERAVWIDFLCLATMNFGEIRIPSRRQLARQLIISRKLLDRSIEKFLKFKKIEKKCEFDAQLSVSEENGEIFIITKWEHFQADYLTRRLKKSTTTNEKERIVKQGFHDSEFCPKGEERIEENITLQEDKNIINIERNKDSLEDNEIPLENHPSSNQKPFTDGKNNLLQEFLARLGSCPGYSSNDYRDTIMFNHVYEDYPGIDILKELDKKIAWWGEHPEALELAENPQQKLIAWFEKEYEFQSMRGQEGE